MSYNLVLLPPLLLGLFDAMKLEDLNIIFPTK